jgi:hypothetical protein
VSARDRFRVGGPCLMMTPARRLRDIGGGTDRRYA